MHPGRAGASHELVTELDASDESIALDEVLLLQPLEQRLKLDCELAPLWWTSRKGLLSSEFRQCSREKIVQIHSRKTLSAA